MAIPLSSAKKRVRELRRIIKHHTFVYHTRNRTEIPDPAYDRLFRELEELEGQFPELVTPDSPTQKTGGATLSKLPPAPHKIPMLSLSNAFSAEEVSEFDERIRRELGEGAIEYAVEPKIDGLALSLTYSRGRLTKAATRGDGLVGELVTQNVLRLSNVPAVLEEVDFPEDLEIRGEIYMSKSDFRQINESQRSRGEKEYANPRNLAAGMVRQLETLQVQHKPLQFFAYSLVEPERLQIATQSSALDWLAQRGIPVCEQRAIATGVQHLLAYYESIGDQRAALEYMIDGVVYKVNDLADQRTLGEIARAPKYAIAHKYPPERVVTKLVAIEVSVGRTGALTPVARLAPIQVGGVTVTNATLHNESEVNRKHLRIGRDVYVQRAGDVIPEVVGAVDDTPLSALEEYRLPNTCPICDSRVIQSSEDSTVRCSGGLFCPAQLKQAIVHFSSRKAMNIQGIGEGLVDVLVDEMKIRGPSDLYRLDELTLARLRELDPASTVELVFRGSGSSDQAYRLFLESAQLGGGTTLVEVLERKDSGQLNARSLDELSTLAIATIHKTGITATSSKKRSRVGEKDAIRIRAELDRSKSVPLNRFIFALGILHVGEEIAKSLAKNVDSIDDFMRRDWMRLFEQKELATKAKGKTDPALRAIQKQFHGIGKEIFESIHAFLSETHNVDEINRLLRAGVQPTGTKVRDDHSGPLAGKTFVFTGSLAAMTKAEAEKVVESLGGEILGSVSKRLDYLVIGDISDPKPSNKLTRARELKKAILTEAEFQNLLEQSKNV